MSSPICPKCGIPFSGAGEDHLCGSCLSFPPAFDRGRGAFLYEGAIRDLIHAFKYNQKIHLRYPLAMLTLQGISDFQKENELDIIIPVPLHRKRLRQRGFNQAVLLGQIMSRVLSLPMLPDAMTRVRYTEPQVELSSSERRLNVKGAFSVKDGSSVAGKRILLLDDVMTTGSTMDECSRELKKAGAANVTAITIARTPK